ncbi:MAG: response regulator [Nitrospirae bacterium]|nr:MAG: response regulator [Nitrospirota bacterium]
MRHIMSGQHIRHVPHWMALLIGVIVLAAAVIGGVTFRNVVQQRAQLVGAYLANDAEDVAETIDGLLFERYGDTQMMADAFPALVYNSTALTQYLTKMKERYLVYDWLGMTDRDGQVVAATDSSMVGEDWSRRSWFLNTRDRRDVYLEQVGDADVEPDPGLIFSTAIRDDEGRFLGVVVSRVKLTIVREIIEKTMRVSQETEGAVGINEWQVLNKQGSVVMGSLTADRGLVNLLGLGVPSASRGLSEQRGYVEEMHRRRQVPVITGYATTHGEGSFMGPGWVVLLRVDRDAVIGSLHVAAREAGLGAAVVIGPLLVLLLWQGRRLRKAWAAGEEQNQTLRLLLATTRDLTVESDTQAILTQLTQTARQITGAKYAALGVFNETGTALTQFITSGMDEALREKIGALPMGRGLLGHLADEPGALRLKDLAQHAASCGFPAHHPEMHSFLGSSIRVGGRLLGRLYVTEKQGGSEFTEMDEQTITALAMQAGDLIERCSLLNQLQAAHAQSSALLESVGEGICGIDAQGRILFLNQAGAALVGYEPHELIGQSAHERLHYSHADGTPYPFEQCPIYEVLRTGAGCRMEGEVYWRKDGTSFPVEYAAAPLRRDETVVGAVISFNDITARKQTEQAFRSLVEGTAGTVGESFFRSLVQHLAAALNVRYALAAEYTNEARDHARTIAIWDGTGLRDNFEYSLAGGPCERLLGTTQWFCPRDLRRQFPSMEMLATLETESYLGISLRDAAGRALGLLVVMDTVPMIESELSQTLIKIFGARAAVELERKRAEAALANNNLELAEARDQALGAVRMKSQFLATVSHEIRTPMNGVLGMADLLLSTDLTADQRDYATTIVQSGKVLLTILNDILDFSKMEAAKLEVKHVEFKPRPMLDEILALLATQAHSKGLELTSCVQADVPTTLHGDPHRLSQILINLVGNAIKFTEAGEVAIRLGPAGTDSTDVRFEVRDSGIGIAPEAQARLFQPFSQVDGSNTRKYGGTGLGLAICRQLVHLMGGEIGVESRPGQGSTFWFTIRQLRQAEPPAAPSASRADLRGLRVCLVGVHETNRAILMSHFQDWGVRSVSLKDVPQALEALRVAVGRGEPFDVAMVGIHVSGAEGLVFARTIKADAELASVRLVLLASAEQPVDVDQARLVGIETILWKPIQSPQLYACLAGVSAVPTPVPSSVQAIPVEASPVREVPRDTHAGDALLPAHPRILLAEDNLLNQKVATHMLAKLECHVDMVATGVEALDALSRASYDLVLMDCQMPEMDGFQAAVLIRQREGGVRRTPIVAMTANVLLGDRERCLVAGMDDYLPKPVTLASLREVLQRWVSGDAPSPSIPQAVGSGVVSPALSPGVQAGPPPAATEGTQEAGPAVFNRAQALARTEGDVELLKSLAGLFVAAVPQELAGIREAVAKRDAAVLMQKAHKLQGAVLQFCAPDVLAAVRSMEALGRGGDLAGVETACADLEKNVMGLVEALKAVMEETTVCR